VDRRIRRLGIALVALFGLLFVQLAYVQVFAASRISGNPANASRQIIAEYKVDRGAILTADGQVLAESTPATSKTGSLYRREYQAGPLYAAITGYYSRIYGRSALEEAMNDYLTGSAPELAVSNFTDLILGRPKQGGSVVTTIQSQLQLAAQRALGTLPGAIVAMDPTTGNILAMVANPSFDPNKLSSGTDAQMNAYWDRLGADPATPLVSRAKDQLYLPGSTFKMITASAALQAGYAPLSTWANPHQLDLPLTSKPLENFGNEVCAGGASKVTMLEAFTESCNVPWAEIGMKLGAGRLQAQAQAYGFCPTDPPTHTTCLEPTVPFVIPFQTGRFPIPAYFEQNDPLLAYSAIGLDNVLTNPMQMALVGSAIANRGIEMQPRLVTQIRDPQGRVVRTFPAAEYGRPISSDSADSLRQMMINVVEHGTGYPAQLSITTVAGKTGTATNGPNTPPNAWFVSFAPAGRGEGPARIAVAVIVLDGGNLGNEATGGQVAAPIAAQVIRACLTGACAP
jgi:peptidoglycan glycosyltransferase